MPYLTNLADIARRTGYPVEEVPGWKTRGHGPMIAVRTIVPHHTATSRHATGDYPSLRIVRDGTNGLPGPLSQIGLGRSGKIYIIAAGRCWHAGATFYQRQENSYSLGIEAENDGLGEPWPAAQMDSYRKLCAELAKAFQVPTAFVEGHKEIAKPAGRKVDPSFDMSTFRRGVDTERAGVVKPAASKPASNSGSTKPWPSGRGPWPDAYLTRAGKRNKYQDKALHNLLGRVGHTGTFAQRLQKWCRADGTYTGQITPQSNDGPQTTRAWQTSLSRRTNPKTGRRFYTGRIDGKWGPQTANGTVDWLNWQADIIHGKG